VSFYNREEETNTGNSMCKEQTSYFENMNPIQQMTTTLDNTLVQNATLLMASCGYNNDEPADADAVAVVVDYTKVNVQGGLLLVLLGSSPVVAAGSYSPVAAGDEPSTIVNFMNDINVDLKLAGSTFQIESASL
jgi:hypothetical protein